MGAWKIILPESSRNYCLNPIAMGTGNYAAVGTSTVTVPTTHSYFGFMHYDVVTDADNEGIAFTLYGLSNSIHYVTLRTYGAPTAAWDWNLDGANFNIPTLLGYEGDWYVYGYQFPAAQANASTTLQILTRGVAVNHFVIGHVQVELKSYATTPITGDLKGFYPTGYKWEGTPHASTSIRSHIERSGGLEVDLEDTYNFRVLYGLGSGMPPIQHHVQGMALLPGALYGGHKVLPRVLDLVSGTKVNTTTTVATARKNFINAIKPDRVVPEQPVVFRYYMNTSKPVEFHAVYDSGMEFQLSSGVVDKPVARFICYDPFVYETHTESKALVRYSTVTAADYVCRKIDGYWYNVSTNFDGTVLCMTQGKDGCIYMGGSFTIDAPDTDYIIKWNPYTSALSILAGTGTDADVFALVTAANGDIYLGGAFTNAHAIANTTYIAKWNGTEFVELGGGLGNFVYSLAIGQDGALYVGGTFTDAGAVAAADRIAKWNGAAWSALGTGAPDGSVDAMAIAPNGDLYITGTFSSVGGVANTLKIARWGTNDATPAWHPLGTGLDDNGESIAIDKAGNVYVGGAFHNADGVACAHIAKWNGKTFEPLGSGTDDRVYELHIDDYGQLYAGGSFTVAGGITLADKVAVWNGTTWGQLDIDLPGNPYVGAILPIGDDIYLGYSTAGDATASYTNLVTVSNSGSHITYPVIKIQRVGGTSCTLKWIKNETTKQKIRCNYSLQLGETLTIDLTPGDRSIISDFSGDVWRAVLRGSDLAEFGLIGGTNYVTVYCEEVGATTDVNSFMEWKVTHWAADTAI